MSRFLELATAACAAAVIFFQISSYEAAASPLDWKVFGHQLSLTSTAPSVNGEYPSLSVDGRQLLSAPYIDFDEFLMIGNVGVIIGRTAQGGNMCTSAPFVISFPPGEPARIDGPLDQCVAVSHSVDGETITFQSPAGGSGGDVFAWKPAFGFTQLGSQGRSVDETKGWAELRRRDVEHPGELLDYGQLSAQIQSLAGPDRAEYERLINGVAEPGEYRGDTYVWTSCEPHNCPNAGAILVADVQKQRLFIA